MHFNKPYKLFGYSLKVLKTTNSTKAAQKDSSLFILTTRAKTDI